MGGQCDSSKQEYQASTHTRIHKSIYILSLIPHIFLLYAKINNSFTTFFPYSKISRSFTIFFPHSKLNHSFMIFSLPIPEQDSLSLPPVHYTTHLILFYFILSSFYSQTSPVSACLSQNPQPTRHGTDTAHQSTVFPSLESSPREDTSHAQWLWNTTQNPALKSSKGDSGPAGTVKCLPAIFA